MSNREFYLNKIQKLSFLRVGKNGYKKDFFSFAIGFFLTALLALFTTIIVNKNLTKAELGEFSFYKSTFELLSYVLTLLVYRSYLRFNSNGVSLYTVKFVSRLSIFALIVLSIVIFFVTGNIFSALFSLFIVYEERTYFFRSILNTKSLNYTRIGAALITFVSVLIFANVGSLTSNDIFISYGVGFCCAIFMYRKNYSIKDDNEELNVRKLLLFSFPALLTLLIKLSLEYNVQLTVKEYFGFVELSKFSIAIRVLLSVRLFSNMINMFYPSVYFRELETGNFTLIKKIRRLMILVVFSATLIAFFFTDELYLLMGAKKYIEFSGLFKILLLSELFFTLSNFYGIYLSHLYKTIQMLIIYFIGALINLFVLFSFINNFGVHAAAYAMLASNIFLFTFHFFYTKRKEDRFMKQHGKSSQ